MISFVETTKNLRIFDQLLPHDDALVIRVVFHHSSIKRKEKKNQVLIDSNSDLWTKNGTGKTSSMQCQGPFQTILKWQV
jgi:hypothetical protein